MDFVRHSHPLHFMTFPETDMLDWPITRPDGTEEGNFVGKFLDTYSTK